MTLSYDYWKDREEKARQQTIRDEKRHEEEIEEIYKRMFDEIQRDIDSFFAKYAADEGITIAEAKKRVSKLDMEEFERKAKKYVKEKDFSDQANEEMKLYNLTMKVNRLEMLKAKIGLELVNGYQEIEDYMGEALTETTMKGIERHAGILGETVGNNQDYAEDIVDASFHNATWSERIWANQDRLKHDLGKLLTSGLIQGKNPRELARDLQKSMNVSKYDAERLMRTEMCRVQIDASLREIEANGFTRFIFIADSGGSRTCEQCKALDGKTFALKDGKIGVNLPPLHPNCRCSIAGHVDDDEFLDFMDELGVELTDKELADLGLSRSSDKTHTENQSPDITEERRMVYRGAVDDDSKGKKNQYLTNPRTAQDVVDGYISSLKIVGNKADAAALKRYLRKELQYIPERDLELLKKRNIRICLTSDTSSYRRTLFHDVISINKNMNPGSFAHEFAHCAYRKNQFDKKMLKCIRNVFSEPYRLTYTLHKGEYYLTVDSNRFATSYQGRTYITKKQYQKMLSKKQNLKLSDLREYPSVGYEFYITDPYYLKMIDPELYDLFENGGLPND